MGVLLNQVFRRSRELKIGFLDDKQMINREEQLV